ncbi:MAG: tyrosine-type recombinase/integrase [Luteolibacter sp.]
MAKQIRFTPKKCPSGWRLNIPAKLSDNGKRQQFFYRTQKLALDAAVEFKKKLDEFGSQTRAISPSVAEQASAAKALLDPYGISILDAAQRIVEAEKIKIASVTVEDALKAFIQAKEDRSSKHTQAIRHMADHLLEKFKDRNLSTVTGPEIETHIDAHVKGPSAFNAKVRLHRNFWHWCANPKRGWCRRNELDCIEHKREEPNSIGTLTADQAKALLDAAETHLPDCVIPLAIGLFTGMRQAEIRRLEPTDITDEGLLVSAANDRKKQQRRFVQMPENFKTWLEAYPIKNVVCPPNYPRKEKALRRLAGFRVWSDYVTTMDFDPPMSASPDEDAVEWPNNALRHTAASVSVALKKPLSDLIFEHGHSGGEETLKRHYVGLMTPKNAKKIWSLAPKKNC